MGRNSLEPAIKFKSLELVNYKPYNIQVFIPLFTKNVLQIFNIFALRSAIFGVSMAMHACEKQFALIIIST